MLRPTLLVAFGAALVSVACGGKKSSGDDSDASSDVTTLCAEYCKHSRSLECGDPLAGCEADCSEALTSTFPAACVQSIMAVYSCQNRQPATEYSCSLGQTPLYTGTNCDAEAQVASDCLRRELPPATPACQHYCELDGTVCAHPNVDNCKEACRIIGLIPECAEEYEAHVTCLAAFDATALVCNAELLEAADGSCDDEYATLRLCFDAN